MDNLQYNRGIKASEQVGLSGTLGKKQTKKEEMESAPPKDTVEIKGGKETTKTQAPLKEKEVSVLIYMDGQYPDLEPGMADSLLKLERLGSNDKMNIVAELGRAPQEQVHEAGGFDRMDSDWSGVRRYYVVKGQQPTESEDDSIKDLQKIASKLPDNPLVHFLKFCLPGMFWSIIKQLKCIQVLCSKENQIIKENPLFE